MRIISGKFRSKKLLLPDPKITRPLRDYVKESIFNLLMHSKLLNFNFNQSTILDLFSGSGSFGFECISRGSSKVIFIEKEKKILNILYKNIHNLLINEYCIVINNDVLELNLQKFIKDSINLLFLDPPFQYNFLNNLFQKLQNNSSLFLKTLIIIHYENKNRFDFNNYLNIIIKKKYGRSIIIFGTLKY